MFSSGYGINDGVCETPFGRRHLRMVVNPFILVFDPIPETEEML